MKKCEFFSKMIGYRENKPYSGKKEKYTPKNVKNSQTKKVKEKLC